jgi:hypothetical protein
MQSIIKRQNLDFYIALVVGILGVAFAFYWNYTHPHIVVKYDCSIAEISPDYPVQVKEACRNLRAEKILQSPK